MDYDKMFICIIDESRWCQFKIGHPKRLKSFYFQTNMIADSNASAKNIYLGKCKEKASISAWSDTTTGNIRFDLSTQFSAAIYDI